MTFGAFRPTLIARVGQVRYWKKKSFYLSQNQKKSVRKRLKEVDDVVDTLLESNVKFPSLTEAASMKKHDQMTPKEKYYVFSKDPKTHMKPITQVPHFTKVPHPRGFPKHYQ